MFVVIRQNVLGSGSEFEYVLAAFKTGEVWTAFVLGKGEFSRVETQSLNLTAGCHHETGGKRRLRPNDWP